MTHKEKQGLTVLAIILVATLASIWIFNSCDTRHAYDATPVMATSLSATASATDTISATAHDETSAAPKRDTHAKKASRSTRRKSAAADRKSPLDIPVNN